MMNIDASIAKSSKYFIGLTLTVISLTPAFAILPMTSEVFQFDSDAVASITDKEANATNLYSAFENNDSMVGSSNKDFITRSLKASSEPTVTVHLEERTVIMKSIL